MVDFLALIDRVMSPPEPVNIWSLNKEPRVKCLLLQLAEQLGRSEWYIDQTARTNREAVYLIHKDERDLRAYLHIHGQHEGRAGLHLEFPRVADRGPTYEAYEDLSIQQLVDMLAAHFGVSQIAPEPAFGAAE